MLNSYYIQGGEVVLHKFDSKASWRCTSKWTTPITKTRTGWSLSQIKEKSSL